MADTITTPYIVSLKDFAQKVKRFGDQMEEAAIRGIQSAGLRLETMIPEAIQDTSPDPPIDTGALMGSHYTEFTPRGAIVGVDAPHAPFMENGTRPHRPPFQPIADWAYRKGLIDIELTEEDIEADYSDEEELGKEVKKASGIVFGIIGKIAKEGIEPRHFMKRAVEQFLQEKIIDEEIQRELEKAK
jgi:hypothetical protein